MPQQPSPTGWSTPGDVVKLDDAITQAAATHRVKPDLLRKLIKQESGGNGRAVSPKGARGVAQFMPATAQERGVNPDHALESVEGAAKLLREHLDTFGGDEAKALAAYNAGPGAVKKYGGVPPFGETRNYVQSIQGTAPPTAPPAPAAPSDGWMRPNEVFSPGAVARPQPAPPVAPVRGPIGPQAAPPAPSTLQLPLPGGGLVTVPTPSASTLGGIPSTLASIPQRVGESVGGFVRDQFGSREGIRQAASVGIPAVAAIGGGAAGMWAGGPTGAMAGAAATAPLGEAAVMGVEAATGAPPSMEDVSRRMGWAGGTALAGEGAGQALIKAGRPFAKHFDTALASQAYDRFTESVPTSITGRATKEVRRVLPSEVSTSRGLNVMENVVEGSILGGGRASAAREARQKIAERDVTKALDSLGPRLGTRGAGETALEARDRAIANFRTTQNLKYDKFRELGKDIPVESPSLDAFAQEVSGRGAKDLKPGVGLRMARRLTAMFAPVEKEADAIGFRATAPPDMQAQVIAAGAGKPGAAPTSEIIQRILQESADGPPDAPMTADQGNEMVKSLGRWMRQLEKETRTNSDKNADYGLVKKLYSLAKDDLDESITKVNPAALEALDAGRVVTKEGKERLFNDTVLQMARTAPEKLTQSLLKKNNSSAVQLVRSAVGEEGMAPIRAAAMEEILAADPVSKRIKWTDVIKRMDTRYGRDTMEAMFPGGQHHEVAKIAGLMLDLDRKPVGQLGRVAIQLTQASAGLALLTNPFGVFQDDERSRAVKASAIILGPAVLARVFASPVGLKWLTMGLTHGAGTQTGIRASTQFMAFLAKEGLLSEKQKESALPPLPPPDKPFGLSTPPPGAPTAPFRIGG